MQGKFYFSFVMLAALTMTMVFCDKNKDDTSSPSEGQIEIVGACALTRGSTDPSVDEFSAHDLNLFGEGINPNNFYVNGYGDLESGWVICIKCCCLNEEVAKLDKGEKAYYHRLVPGTYTWDGSQEDKHLRIQDMYAILYENDKRVEDYSSNDITACTVEIKRGRLGEKYELSGEISFTNGEKLSFVWEGGQIQHRYNAQ